MIHCIKDSPKLWKLLLVWNMFEEWWTNCNHKARKWHCYPLAMWLNVLGSANSNWWLNSHLIIIKVNQKPLQNRFMYNQKPCQHLASFPGPPSFPYCKQQKVRWVLGTRLYIAKHSHEQVHQLRDRYRMQSSIIDTLILYINFRTQVSSY